MAITIIVTNAGRAALVNAANTGTNAVTISQMGVTQTAFVPNAAQVALPGEVKRIASVGGIVVSDDVIHVTVSDTSNAAYAMRGLAFYLADGTLFAIYGQAGAILNKTAESMMLLALDIAFADIDAEMIEFGDTNFILPQATTEILGLVELATTAEAQTGTDNQRALTPLTGKQSAFGWILSQDGSGSGLDADLLDGQHASAFALAGHTHGTMAAQNANSVAITGGAIEGVTLSNITAPVGIACTALPSTSLQVRIGANRRFSVFSNGADNVFGYLTDAGNWADTFMNGSTLRFGIGGAEKMRLSNTGVLMLGATAAISNENLLISQDVAATTYPLVSNMNAAGFAGYGMQTAGGSWGMRVAANGVLRFDQNFLGASVNRAMFDTNGHFRPGATATSDLGTAPVRWNTAYLSGLDVQTAAGQFTVAAAGAASVKLSSSGTMQYDTGAASAHQFLVAGADAASIGTYGLRLPNGNGGVPSLSFAADPDTGIYASGANSLLIATGGTTRASVDATGRLLPNTDNLQDFGWSGGGWRTGYFGTSVLIGGNAAFHAGNDGSGSGLDADLLDGQHGTYYLPAASYTAADVRTKLLTVDGAGSAIDADLLDGQHGAYYLPAASYTAADILAKLLGVDGSGSGLDADMLDGLQAADFVKYSDFTGSNQNIGQPGRQRFPGGFMIQTGTYTVGANSTATISFGTSFNSICLGVFCGNGRQDFAAQDNNPFVSSYNIGGATVYSSADASVTGPWLAIGF